MPALVPLVAHIASAIAGALCIRLFDNAVPIKKAPELVGRA